MNHLLIEIEHMVFCIFYFQIKWIHVSISVEKWDTPMKDYRCFGVKRWSRFSIYELNKICIWMFTIYGRSFLETFTITWSWKKLGTWLAFWRVVYKFLEVLFHEAIKRAHDVRIMLITIHLNTFIWLIDRYNIWA